MRNLLTVCLAFPIALAGCASNQLLREETARFVKAADKSVVAGNSFYIELVASSRDSLTLLYSLDRDCQPDGRKVYVDLRAVDNPEPGASPVSFCSTTPALPEQKPLPPAFARKDFKLEFVGLRFVRDYIEALAKLVEDPKLHASANFGDALTDLQAIKDAVDKDGASLLKEERITAVQGLIGFLQKLSKEAASAAGIRKILQADSATAHKRMLVLVDRLALDSAINRELNSARREVIQFAMRFDASLDSGMRRELMTSRHRGLDDVYDAEEAQRDTAECKTNASKSKDPAIQAMAPYCGKPAALLMYSASIAHVELTDLAKGKLNQRQKARKAKLGLSRFLEALRLLVDVRDAF